jgi:rod shape-determining protein MreC
MGDDWLQRYKNELESLYKANNSKLSLNPDIELVRAISYENFGDLNKLWLEVKDYNGSKIYGLIYKNYVAGIVINKNNMPLALLNNDPKSSYAVSIGKQNAPGIAHGNNEKDIVVTYIPSWYEIKVGDEIVTSGLDNIFFKGIKVGVIKSITTSQGYKKAIVKPYYNSNELNYFYMIKKVR